MKTKLMKTLALSAILYFTASAQASTPAQDAFARLKALAGTWTFKSDSETSTITYEIASGGTSVVERFEGMVTVYHLDGETVLATHYCTLGNQPRMRAVDFTTLYASLEFKFVDITNLKAGKPHIAGVKFDWIDDNHVVETWTDRSGEGKETTFSFKMERSFAPAPIGGGAHIHP